MDSNAVAHSSFTLTRTYPKPPGRVFEAFSDVAKKRRWFAAGEHHEVEAFELDFRVGGFERARQRFTAGTPFQGAILSSETLYFDIVPDRRIVFASAMSFGDRRISVALVTIELAPERDGTKLTCTHHAAYFEGADGPQVREAGWRKLFERLAGELSS